MRGCPSAHSIFGVPPPPVGCSGEQRAPAGPGLGRRGRPPDQRRKQPLRRHPPVFGAAPGALGRAAVPEGRVHPPHRQPQAPAGAFAVPFRPRQRLDPEGTTIVEASSGSTAVSEAYFAQLLGLPFIAVMTRTTSREKIALIEQFGGSCLLVDHASEVYEAAADLARSTGGHYMDQFTYAERATDWRGQQQHRRVDLRPAGPRGAPGPPLDRGRGRHRRHQRHDRPVPAVPPPRARELAVVDPENSAFYPGWLDSRSDGGIPAAGGTAAALPSRIEGIGRPRMEPSFVPAVIDHMIQVPGRRVGGGHAAPAGATPGCTPARPPAPTFGACGSSSRR